MFGFDLFSIASEESISIWPESELAFQTFSSLRTQWRIGMAGPTGLDYTAVLAVIDQLDLRRSEAASLFSDMQHMEYAALEQMAENSNDKK